MGRTLKHDVHIQIQRKDRFDTIVLRAGTEVPKHLKKYVPNPKAYVGVDTAEPDTGETSTDERDELIAELKKRDLPTDGSIDELKQRIAEHDAEIADQENAGSGNQEE
jgi:hypothetical protein